MEKEIILSVESLSKHYGELKAVDNISFNVKRGQFFAFLGPNGAGKSTTIKVITTLLKQDAGIFKLNNQTDNSYIRNKIGVVFQENILDNLLTVKENLLLRGALYIHDKAELEARYRQLVEQFSLQDLEKKRFKVLSGGEKRRVEIARALFARPEILFLDEPTTGLDPENRKVVWSIIENLKNETDLTVFLTTHYMEETNNADHVIIINKGKIVASGSPTELKIKHAHDIFKIKPKNKSKLTTYLKNKKIEFKPEAEQFVISIPNTNVALDILNNNQDNIKSFELIKGSMDDVFLNVVENGKWEI